LNGRRIGESGIDAEGYGVFLAGLVGLLVLPLIADLSLVHAYREGLLDYSLVLD
jgi:hypothetical protein